MHTAPSSSLSLRVAMPLAPVSAVLAALLLSACGSAPLRTAGETLPPPPAERDDTPVEPPQAAPPPAPAPVKKPALAQKRGGGYYQDDGPGDNPPSALEAVPDAEPRLEPLHRYANRPYVVFGQEYVPGLKISPYREQGLASWYGRKFHGQNTSSGEPYDMYGMTAAHPTLPIPSYARVTNLANNRSVVVRINDRGPFLKGRLIDLSYTAAYKLGYAEVGSAKVRVDAIVPDDMPALAANRQTPPPALRARPATTEAPARKTELAAADRRREPEPPAPVPAKSNPPKPSPATTEAAAPLLVAEAGPAAASPPLSVANSPLPPPAAPLASSSVANTAPSVATIATAPTTASSTTPAPSATSAPPSVTSAPPSMASALAAVEPAPAKVKPAALPALPALPPTAVATIAGSPATATRGAFLQLGTFATQANAEDFRKQVRAQVSWLGERLQVLADNGYYRLHVGPYASADEARSIGERIATVLKFKPFLVWR